MTRYLLTIALALATAAAACADAGTDTLDPGGKDPASTSGGSRNPTKPGTTSGDTTGEEDGDGTPASGGDTTPQAPVPTNSPKGKEFFKTQVHPFLATSCGACHEQAGPGPAFLSKTDAEKSYLQLATSGYVIPNSRIIQKPAHGGLTNNVLSPAQIKTYNDWIAMEVKDGGTKAAPNILEKLGSCFDRQKFDAMQMGQWRTTRRTNNNNTNNVTPWNENANNCTGCDNAPCTTCHSADPATNYNNAVGNTLLPADTTFENTKLTNPAYITKFFGVSPDGKPVASDGIKKKSDATKKDKAYTHPMYSLNANQTNALNAFVNDAITKFNAGSCGK